jgi:hypothetical protein
MPVWTSAENLAPPPRLDSPTVRPVASRYTDWAMATHFNVLSASKNMPARY